MDQQEEVLEVPASEVHKLIGKGGSTIRTVETRSGAQLSLERNETGSRLRIKGTETSVSKAKRMLNAMIAFGEATSAEEMRLCKCFAAGFCRFGANQCQDGLHSAERAQKAEDDWMKLGHTAGDPLGGEEPELKRPVLLALGCETGGAYRGGCEGEDEVLELAIIAICPQSKRELGRFHRFVKPDYWSREEEKLKQNNMESCFNSSSTAMAFTDVLADLLDWLPGILSAALDDLQPEDFLFVCWRDLELQTLLPRQCNIPAPGAVDEQLQNFLFCRWASLKDIFISHFSLPLEATPHNSLLMLRHLGLSVHIDQGQRNMATQSASTTCRILQELLRKNWEAKPTAWRDEVSAPTMFALPFRVAEVQRFLSAKRTWSQAMGSAEIVGFPPQGHMPPCDFVSGAPVQLPPAPPIMIPPPPLPEHVFATPQMSSPPQPVIYPLLTSLPPAGANGTAQVPTKAPPVVLGAMAKAAPSAAQKPVPPWRQSPAIVA